MFLFLQGLSAEGLILDVNDRNLMAPDEFKNLGLEFSQNVPDKEDKTSTAADQSAGNQNR